MTHEKLTKEERKGVTTQNHVRKGVNYRKEDARRKSSG